MNRNPFGITTLNQYPKAWFIARAVAKKHGYALAIHGSRTYDLDLIAAPWIETCSSPKELALAIAKELKWYLHPKVEDKPHGRLSYLIYSYSGHAHLDLSVMPKAVS